MKAPEPAVLATVLVAEDEVLIRLGIAEHLRTSGFYVFEAANAQEARDVILSGMSIDLVFSDINMPGEHDGVSLALWLYENEFEGVVVLTSGLPSVLADAQARCAQVSAFVPKPYVYDVLEAQLRRLIAAKA